MKPQPDRTTREYFTTMAALVGIGAVTIAGLWLLSFFCMSQPSSPLNLSKWQCGGWWSTIVGLVILIAGLAAMTAAWRAINRKS